MTAMQPVLYTPATRPVEQLVPLMNGANPSVRRLVLCTEDSIGECDVPEAIKTIEAALEQFDPSSPTEVFVRLRDHADTMDQILNLEKIVEIDGFVTPKAHPTGFPKYAEPILRRSREFRLLPIIEHRKTPDAAFRRSLLQAFLEYKSHIDCVRIGGNDLLGHQGLRRAAGITIYDTVIGDLIASIVNEFRGIGGFEVTAPVFESYSPAHDNQLRSELYRSIANGLFGQTVIHPRHLQIILETYRVPADDYTSAKQMVEAGDRVTAVQGHAGRMDEAATHLKWAQRTLKRAELFGVLQ